MINHQATGFDRIGWFWNQRVSRCASQNCSRALAGKKHNRVTGIYVYTQCTHSTLYVGLMQASPGGPIHRSSNKDSSYVYIEWILGRQEKKRKIITAMHSIKCFPWHLHTYCVMKLKAHITGEMQVPRTNVMGFFQALVLQHHLHPQMTRMTQLQVLKPCRREPLFNNIAVGELKWKR